MSGAEIVRIARSYIDTPYHHQGRQPGVGLDCAGLVVCACRAAGHAIVDYHGYSSVADPQRMYAAVRRNAEPIHGDLQPGDWLWLRLEDPQHLAIYTGEGTIIHALSRMGYVREHRYAAAWAARLHTALRHKDLL